MFSVNTAKLIILDRDGVINADSPHYIKSPEEFNPLPRSLEAITRLQKAGFKIAIASNQSGLARGYFSPEVLNAIHQKLKYLLEELGGTLPSIYICPHAPEANCSCRKPLPGLIQQISTAFHLAPEQLINIPFIGDSERDLRAAFAGGCAPILVKTGNGAKTLNHLRTEDPELAKTLPVFEDLWAFASTLCS